MVHDGCWSTVICTEDQRAALGDTSLAGWVINCRLSIGHRGDHAGDAETVPRFDRRLWIQWNDADAHAQSLIDRNPCSAPTVTPCMLFEGHPGAHWFAPSNGHPSRPTPTPQAPASTSAPQSGDIPQRSTVDVAVDVPSMRNRSVPTPGLDDPQRVLDQPPGRHGGAPGAQVPTGSRPFGPALSDPAVLAALDDVVAALARLTDLLRAPGGRRSREN